MATAARVPLQSQSLRREEPEAGGQSKRAPRGRIAQGQARVLAVHGGGAVLVVARLCRARAGAKGSEGQSRAQDVALGVALGVALEVQGFGHCTGRAVLWEVHRGGAGRRAADSVISREQSALRLSSHCIARSGSRSCAWRLAALSRLSPGKRPRLPAGAGCSSRVPGAFSKS